MKRNLVLISIVTFAVVVSACTKSENRTSAEKNATETQSTSSAADNPQGDPVAVSTDQPILDESGLGAPAQSATPAPAGETPAPAAPAAN
jgi:hypothetical protein